MKKIILLILPFVFLFSNCKKNDDFLFEMQYLNDFTISAGLNPFSGIHVFETKSIPSNALNIFTQNGVTDEDLEVINPGVANLSGIFTSPENGYIQEISIKIFSADDPSFEKEIFYREQIPQNASGDLGLIGTLVDTKEFLTKEDFGIRIEMRLRDISPETIDMRLNFSFFAR